MWAAEYVKTSAQLHPLIRKLPRWVRPSTDFERQMDRVRAAGNIYPTDAGELSLGRDLRRVSQLSPEHFKMVSDRMAASGLANTAAHLNDGGFVPVPGMSGVPQKVAWAAAYMKTAAEKAAKPPPPPTPADKLVFSQRIKLMNRHLQEKQAMPFGHNALTGELVHLPRSGASLPAPVPMKSRSQIMLGKASDREMAQLGLGHLPHADPPPGFKLVPPDVDPISLGGHLPFLTPGVKTPVRKGGQRQPYGHGTAGFVVGD